ncbi:MAG: glycosyltransferase family protein [Acidobacteriia bacterium]|nr:glycosyltransferase family protein [Terriglobia bacterium]
MNTLAIIQARMGSSRLPGKVLMDLGGASVLARVVGRLGRSQEITQIVVATTVAPADDAIVRECERLHVSCFRGSEDDVLDRYYQCARAYPANAIVRITSDCPLIDPNLVDETVIILKNQKADYASNVIPRTYPRGLDTEVFTSAALERAWREAHELYEREHVTPYFYEHPKTFRMASVSGAVDYSRYRWTLDTREDLELLRAIYSRFDSRHDLSWQDVIALMEREPELAELNSQVLQKSLREH